MDNNMEFEDYDTPMKLFYRFNQQLENMEQAIAKYREAMDKVDNDEDDGSIMGDSQTVIIAICREILEVDRQMVEFTREQTQKWNEADKESKEAIKRASKNQGTKE